MIIYKIIYMYISVSIRSPSYPLDLPIIVTPSVLPVDLRCRAAATVPRTPWLRHGGQSGERRSGAPRGECSATGHGGTIGAPGFGWENHGTIMETCGTLWKFVQKRWKILESHGN